MKLQLDSFQESNFDISDSTFSSSDKPLNKKSMFRFLSLIFVFSLFFIQVNAATTYYVNDGSTAGDGYTTAVGNNANPGTSALPFLTIQYALTIATSSGDIIMVDAGTYIEVGQIVIGVNLSIIGLSKTLTIIKPDANTASGGAWILVNSSINFDLSKVKLDGTGYLIYFGIKHQGSGTINDCNLTGMKYNESTDYKGTAIFIISPATVNVTNCTFTQIGRNGILADQCLGLFDGNTYTGKGTGDFLDYFILSEYGDNITISNNIVSDCKGVASSDGSTSSAISVWDDPGTQALITGNTLTNNTIGVAIAAYSGGTSNPTVIIGAGNLFDGGDYGVTFETIGPSYTPNVTFTGVSTFKAQTIYAIRIDAGVSAGAIIDISSVVFKTAGDVVITDNFAIEDLVYHAIDATNRGLLKWNGTNVYVTPLSGSIKRAIAAVPTSWTVNVDEGTYIENGQILIDKNLTIIGANKTTTIIKPDQNTGNTGDARGWFLIESGKTFNLSNVTLDGTGYLIYMGIYYWGNGLVNNCDIKNIKYNESGPEYQGRGMIIKGSVDVTNCTFTEIGRIGIQYFGGVGTADRNTMTGKGAGNWLDYGVELGGGAIGTVTNNTITNNKGVAVSDGSTSAGILATTFFPGATAATILNNFINNNTEGIVVGINGSDMSSVAAHENDLSGNTSYAIRSTAPTVNATCNWYGSAVATTVSAKVSGPVTYSPYLNIGTDITPGVTGFQPEPDACNACSTGVTNMTTGITYCTLEDATEDAQTADGDIIEIPTGTYATCVTVDNSITLKAIGGPVTLTCLTMNGVGKDMVLGSNLTITTLTLTNGKIHTNGFNLNVGTIIGGNATNYIVTD